MSNGGIHTVRMHTAGGSPSVSRLITEDSFSDGDCLYM